MTAEGDSLLAAGALKSLDRPEEVGSRANVDVDKLGAFARAAVAEFVPELAEAQMVPGQLQIFDFSTRMQSNVATRLVDGAMFGATAAGSQAVVTRVGDALQEPFWPEGLGINRGFLHCLDCADLTENYAALLHAHPTAGTAARAAAEEALMARREELFKLCKKVSGKTRLTELKKAKDSQGRLAYGIDPATRYTGLPPSLPAAMYEL